MQATGENEHTSSPEPSLPEAQFIVDGFACQKRWVIPEWDEIIRAWVRGLGTAASASGQSGDSLRGPYIEIHRRTGVNLDAD